MAYADLQHLGNHKSLSQQNNPDPNVVPRPASGFTTSPMPIGRPFDALQIKANYGVKYFLSRFAFAAHNARSISNCCHGGNRYLWHSAEDAHFRLRKRGG